MGWGEKASRFDGAGLLIFFRDVGDDSFMRPEGVSYLMTSLLGSIKLYWLYYFCFYYSPQVFELFSSRI